MTTALASPVDPHRYADPADYKLIFDDGERGKIEKQFDPRDPPNICKPGDSCISNLFLGFFFDGTRNNYAVSEQAGNFSHSNIARLFDAYPGQTIEPAVMITDQVKWPDETRYANCFHIYTPDVGSRFDDTEFSKAHDGDLA